VASRTEVAPLVLMECLVRDIPVIAADLKGCREILSPFYDSLFFHRGDAASLALAMEKVLEEGEFERLGSPHPVKVDVRIIASTNRNLAAWTYSNKVL
jgi:glycosyltransferase involved in cell wall biosynthesis